VRLLLALAMISLASFAHAIDRKSITEVDLNALTVEGQVMTGGVSEIGLVWWIPPEFWEVSMRQESMVPEEQVTQFMSVLKSHSVLAVVQANVSPFGSFQFFEKDQIMKGLKVEIVRPNGDVEAISHTEPSDPDLRIMLDQMRPILAQAMGSMGQNFYFFPLPDVDDEGNRLVSPYDTGTLRVRLMNNDVASIAELELPMDALFVPRLCPNGKPAHVSWNYCPWSGKKLKR
jgi:hypothetical protein